MTDDATTTRCCPACHEWYDARAPACYLCGAQAEEYNHALKKANELAALNGNLARQTNAVAGEARAQQMLGQAPSGGGTPRHIGRLPIAGYDTLHTRIRDALEDSGF